jgi:hypothetical protein
MPPNDHRFDDTPDELSPEWAAYESAWAVNVADFGDPVSASQFLLHRKRIFRAAEAAGMSKEMLTPFAPNKPGFEARVEAAFRQVAGAAGMAAE